MSVQGSSMESIACGSQVDDSTVKKQQLKQAITIVKQDINLPFGGSIPISVEFPRLQMELSLVSGNGFQVKEIKIVEKSQKSLLKESPLQGLLQKWSSVEEWKKQFNYNSTEDTFPGFWHKYKISSLLKDKTSKKLVVKKQPLKHKDLLQKPTLLCLQGKSKAKSQEWIKEILKNKEVKTENSNWVRTADMVIESKQFSGTENFYDMKAITDECKNVQKEEEVTRNPRILPYDFQDLIKECENLEGDIYEARIPPSKSSNEVNVNELAGYLDNMLQIPREMSVMAKAMYT